MKHADAVFRAVLCLSTALMMSSSWPLWVTGGEFPQVPWIGGLRPLPVWASWVRFVVAIVAMLIAAVPARDDFAPPCPSDVRALWQRARSRRVLDLAFGVSLVCSAWMVLEDQFRLQPWMYQFLLMGLVLATCPEGRSKTLCRWFVIALYFHSGLSKLDRSFPDYAGRTFLLYLTRPFGIDSWKWPNSTRNAVALLMPCFEIAVAGALAIRAPRIGVIGAILQHLALILILGPWGMNHSTNVLIWNGALMVEVACLFWPNPGETRGAPAVGGSRIRADLVSIVLIMALILPFAERSGWWDTWPSFGLYAASNETTAVTVLTNKPDLFPGPRQTMNERGFDVNLAEWSLTERRVPLYPSSRALNGVAEALASRYGGFGVLKVVHYGRADRRKGDRTRVDLMGLDSIRRFGDTFWLNAHPVR